MPQAPLYPRGTEVVPLQWLRKMSFATSCKALQEGLYHCLHEKVWVVCKIKTPLKCSHTSLSSASWAGIIPYNTCAFSVVWKGFSTQLQPAAFALVEESVHQCSAVFAVLPEQCWPFLTCSRCSRCERINPGSSNPRKMKVLLMSFLTVWCESSFLSLKGKQWWGKHPAWHSNLAQPGV